ncbi:MAG: penicillin acylase family protein, partial [Deltaproteobacteria bacterium]
LAGLGSLWMYFFVVSLLPECKSQVGLAGLNAEVRVVRDSKGVPGILAENEDDAALVLGYVMAQDRLWQMDYLRRAAQGRLAEILGARYLDGDHLMRVVSSGLSNGARLDRLGEKERRWLQRFVRGVNSYISSHSGKLPVEFSWLEYQPEPFSSDDVLRSFLALAWASSPAPRVDPVLTRILGRLGKKRALELFPSDPAASGGMVPADLKGWQPSGILFSRPFDRPNLMRVPGFRGGCMWAVGPAATRNGDPMASCSVYQTLSAPGFWYKARLVAGDSHVSGTFIPGIPVAIVGGNQRVGWGCVSSLADDADLQIERLKGDPPKYYWRVDRWRKLREIKETYRVKGDSSVSRVVRLTETGPLVSEVHDGRALSLRWVAQDGSGFFSAFYALNRARDGHEVRSALRMLVSPALNVVWADADGNVGVQLAGRIPVRPPGSDGIIPLPAWTGVHDWRGFIPFDELPSQTESSPLPPVVADERPGGPTYPFFLSCYWNDNARRQRILELLGQTREHYRETFQKIQGDTVSLLARDLVPQLFKAVRSVRSDHPSRKKAIELLRSWDFHMSRDSAPAAVFALLYQSLIENVFRKSLGDRDYRGFTSYYPLVVRALRKIFVENRSAWLEHAGSKKVLRDSFEKAVERGKSLMGNDPAKWKWGDLHSAVFFHPLTTGSRFLELLYHVGPVPVPGSVETIDFADWAPIHPFRVFEGVSLRYVSEMTQPPELFGISPMGSSGHFFSSHYKDQTVAWSNGRSFRDPIERADIRQMGFNAVVFSPTRPSSPKRASHRSIAGKSQ